MMKKLSRGRLALFALAGLPALAALGCPLTDLQQATILQTTITSGLTSLIQVIIETAAGVVVA